MTDTPPDPERLSALGKRLEEARRKSGGAPEQLPPTALGVAFRFATEMVAALVVGGGLGWGIDRLFGTRPIFLIVMFVLGAAAGIRNVMSAAKELNARMAAANLPSAKDEDED